MSGALFARGFIHPSAQETASPAAASTEGWRRRLTAELPRHRSVVARGEAVVLKQKPCRMRG